VVTGLAAPALAAPPEQWEPAEPVSTLQFLLVLVGIPAALFLVIAVLSLAPSMARGGKHAPGAAWRNEPEWFGGPSGGIEAADKVDPKAIEGHDETARGGASARW
jgi:hypothetical protein